MRASLQWKKYFNTVKDCDIYCFKKKYANQLVSCRKAIKCCSLCGRLWVLAFSSALKKKKESIPGFGFCLTRTSRLYDSSPSYNTWQLIRGLDLITGYDVYPCAIMTHQTQLAVISHKSIYACWHYIYAYSMMSWYACTDFKSNNFLSAVCNFNDNAVLYDYYTEHHL